MISRLAIALVYLALLGALWLMCLAGFAYGAGVRLNLHNVALMGAAILVAYLLGFGAHEVERWRIGRKRRASSCGYEDPLEADIGNALKTSRGGAL